MLPIEGTVEAVSGSGTQEGRAVWCAALKKDVLHLQASCRLNASCLRVLLVQCLDCLTLVGRGPHACMEPAHISPCPAGEVQVHCSLAATSASPYSIMVRLSDGLLLPGSAGLAYAISCPSLLPPRRADALSAPVSLSLYSLRRFHSDFRLSHQAATDGR